MRSPSRWRGLLGATVALLAITACSTNSPAPAVPSVADLASAAATEGSLTWYTAIPTDAANAVVAAFEQQYPAVTVNILRDTTVNLYTKFQQEAAARKVTADVVSFGDYGVMSDAKSAQLLASYVPDSATQAVEAGVLPAAAIDPDGYYVASWDLIIALVYNTSAVPADAVPASWSDLTGPWWQSTGKLGLLDPEKSTGAFYAYNAMNDAGVAQGFFTSIAGEHPTIYAEQGALQNALASGEVDAAIITDYSIWPLIQQGQPMKIVYPTEGAGFSYGYNGVVQGAPHPSAARLFANFLAGKDGATAVAQGLFAYVPRTDVPNFPADKPAVTSLKLLPADAAKAAAGREDFYQTFDRWIGR